MTSTGRKNGLKIRQSKKKYIWIEVTPCIDKNRGHKMMDSNLAGRVLDVLVNMKLPIRQQSVLAARTVGKNLLQTVSLWFKVQR